MQHRSNRRSFPLSLALAACAAPAALAQSTGSDECANAPTITGLGAFSYDTRGKTDSGSIINYPGTCPSPRNDVWFSWTAPQSGRATINTCNPTNNSGTTVAFYGACSDSLPLSCTTQGSGGTCNNAVLGMSVEAGRTYLIRLDSLSQGVGSFTLSMDAVFPGDEPFNAVTLSGAGTFTFDMIGATDNPEGDYFGPDIWLRWTSPATGPTYVTTCGTALASVMELYADTPAGPSAATRIAYNNDDPGCTINWGTASRIDFNAAAGQSYLIRIGIGPWAPAFGTGNLIIAQRPAGAPTGGETITVNTVGWDFDVNGFRQVSDLPGPDGKVSFIEAVTAANLTAGPQTIAFDLNPAEWYDDWYRPVSAAIKNVTGYPYEITDDGLTVDGSTQTARWGDRNPDGPEVSFWNGEGNASSSPLFIVRASNCTFRHLGGVNIMGYDYWLDGNDNRIEDCQLTVTLRAPVSVRGDRNVIARNRLGGSYAGIGLEILGTADGTVVTGNRVTGRNVGILVDGATNTRIGGPTDADRNRTWGVGTRVVENTPTGTHVRVVNAADTLIQNNWIGTTDGVSRQGGNATGGLTIVDSTRTTALDNVISAIHTIGGHHRTYHTGTGVTISGGSATVLRGNRIGTDASGTAPLENGWNITVMQTGPGTVIGGREPGQGNTSAFAFIGDGISLAANTVGVTISGNSIFSNTEIGIDLIPENGVTPNDGPGDPDAGANNLQNFPVLTSVVPSGGGTLVSGALESHPSEAFVLEFFGNSGCDPSGHGEGQTFLGYHAVTTDATGLASFAALLPGASSGPVTATATRVSTSDTSEFSACAAPFGGGLRIASPADFDGSGSVTMTDLFAFIGSWFAHEPRSDFDRSAVVDVADIFAYLVRWFANN